MPQVGGPPQPVPGVPPLVGAPPGATPGATPGAPAPLSAPPGIPIGMGPVTGKGPPQYGEPYPGAGKETKEQVDAREKKTEELWKKIWADRNAGRLEFGGTLR